MSNTTFKRRICDKLTFTDTLINFTYDADSAEEIAVYNWCIEAVEAGLILPWSFDNPIYQPISITVADSVIKTPENNYITALENVKDSKGKILLRGHSYTPDFYISLTDKFISMFPDVISKMLRPSSICTDENNKHIANVYIDVKGSFNLHGGDRVFAINQKWVYQKTGILINKLIPDELFAYTFVPKAEKYTKKTHKLREKYLNCKTLDECLKEFEDNKNG